MTYNQMRTAFLRGDITEQQWQDYCFVELQRVMLENVDVFIRLKDR